MNSKIVLVFAMCAVGSMASTLLTEKLKTKWDEISKDQQKKVEDLIGKLTLDASERDNKLSHSVQGVTNIIHSHMDEYVSFTEGLVKQFAESVKTRRKRVGPKSPEGICLGLHLNLTSSVVKAVHERVNELKANVLDKVNNIRSLLDELMKVKNRESVQLAVKMCLKKLWAYGQHEKRIDCVNDVDLSIADALTATIWMSRVNEMQDAVATINTDATFDMYKVIVKDEVEVSKWEIQTAYKCGSVVLDDQFKSMDIKKITIEIQYNIKKNFHKLKVDF